MKHTILEIAPSNTGYKNIHTKGFIIRVGLKNKKDVNTPDQNPVHNVHTIRTPKKFGFILQK